ncbi:MAG: DUF262 domain-containing protein [Bacteroidales bacterium]|jgi:hypothetical protein|nr:DUF262 domain-containing protein [Bacteroidales bacterium]
MQKYSVNSHAINVFLGWIEADEIAIPEIQRPFVWNSTKVRDLLDSLYKGYPVGYVVAWQNPSTRLKDGGSSHGKKIIIDGQQRIIALKASLRGETVVNDQYKNVNIKIAFHPLEERFEVQNPAILRNKKWIADISTVLNGDHYDVEDAYLAQNPDEDIRQIRTALQKLMNIKNSHIGVIELAHDLDIEAVTDIFIRINSKGMVLSQADFAMSKISASVEYGGNVLRKAIDYFCKCSIYPDAYNLIADNDKEFADTDYYNNMGWLVRNESNLYNPDYSDLIRVAFTSQFDRGRLSDLVSLLSGRNFETRDYEETIAEYSFEQLKTGVNLYINETNFKRFLMIIESTGFVAPKMIKSKNAINFAYALYLKLKAQGVNPVLIERYVRKWFVYSVLTVRYSGSPESSFDYDIKRISESSFEEYLREKEEGELSDAFWNAALPQRLNTSSLAGPYFHVFIAAQIKANDKGFLSSDISVQSLVENRGDIHHIFSRDYLKKRGLEQSKYNQIANYVYIQSEINIKVGNKSPKEYFDLIKSQTIESENLISGISSEKELLENLRMHCIPAEVQDMEFEDYDNFLEIRRKLMAQKIKEYYWSL